MEKSLTMAGGQVYIQKHWQDQAWAEISLSSICS